jgi:calcineurin-like phosphoesterase
MEDLVVLPGDLTDRVVAIAVNYLPDGSLLHSRGDYFEILDEQGNVIKTINLPEHGWGIAQITPTADGEHVLTANIFSGIMLKVRLDDDEVVGSIDTGFKVPKRSLGGVAEYNK